MSVKRNPKQRSRKTNAPELRGWGARMETCFLQVQAVRRTRLSLEEIGALVAAEIGRVKPFKKATVSQWASEYSEPTLEIFEAIALLAECDPWWIVWEVGTPPKNVVAGVSPEAPRGSSHAHQAK
jgi:hypothetical protein